MSSEKIVTAWLTYAWADNRDRDVDFVAQELERAGVRIQRDIWDLAAGQRLWEQIGDRISDPAVQGWIILATSNSLGSEPCREELAYALDRVMNRRGGEPNFPVIALSPGPVDPTILPPALRTRLCVSTLDEQWKERIISALQGRAPARLAIEVEPFYIHVHRLAGTPASVIEFRPRAGAWPFTVVRLTAADYERANNPMVGFGPAGMPRIPVQQRGWSQDADGS